MGVKHLWRTLEKGGAVEQLDGGDPEQHSAILEELEGAVVAVDLSAWLVQAQTQPALAQAYDSEYACALKVVFDRTIHWLRHGCLPLFVIEGATPAAKLEKLRQRCMATYGPTAAQWRVGNNAGSRFSSLGRKVAELLDLVGVPWVQAEGEGEATCAALNMCGWAQGCSTADVDALLFGAVTVYRTLSLSTSNPKATQMARCRRGAVQRVLRLRSGGAQALIAVAQLAGGDYDTAGADRVGDVLALGAVRCLLKGCEDDSRVLQLLQDALADGPDPHLDALTKCTGCKCCGHEGGRKSTIKKHGKEGCAECGTAGPGGAGGCVPAAAADGRPRECGCEFHRSADARLLNRVVRRAVATSGFLDSCRVAAATYESEMRRAVAAVRGAHGLAVQGRPNVFTWRRRPDARGIFALMGRYIPEWDYNHVRLKLLPLLLEWDVRCGPAPPPGSGAQLRPTAIKKVSGAASARAAAAAAAAAARGAGGEPLLPAEGWRYVVEVQRRPGRRTGGGGEAAGEAACPTETGTDEEEAEDLAIDASWLANTARSRPKAAAAVADSGGGSGGGDAEDADEADVGTQGASQAPSQGAAGAGSGGGGGRKAQGTLPFSEHRSVRCSLVHELWPHLVREYLEKAEAPRGKGAKAKGASGKGGGAKGGLDEKQLTLKDFFGVKKRVDLGAASGGGAAKGGGGGAGGSGGGAGGEGGGGGGVRARAAGGDIPLLPPGRGLGGPAAAAGGGGGAPPQGSAQRSDRRAAGAASGPSRAPGRAPAGRSLSGPMDRFLSRDAPGALPSLGKAAARQAELAAAPSGAAAAGREADVISLLDSPPEPPRCGPGADDEPLPLRQRWQQLAARKRGGEQLGQRGEPGGSGGGPQRAAADPARPRQAAGASQPVELIELDTTSQSGSSSDGEADADVGKGAGAGARLEEQEAQRRVGSGSQRVPGRPESGGGGRRSEEPAWQTDRRGSFWRSTTGGDAVASAAVVPAEAPGSSGGVAGGGGGGGGSSSSSGSDLGDAPEELPLMERLMRSRMGLATNEGAPAAAGAVHGAAEPEAPPWRAPQAKAAARAPRFKTARGAAGAVAAGVEAASEGGRGTCGAHTETPGDAPGSERLLQQRGAAAAAGHGSDSSSTGVGAGTSRSGAGAGAGVAGRHGGCGQEGGGRDPHEAVLASPPKKACTPDAKQRLARQAPSASPPGGAHDPYTSLLLGGSAGAGGGGDGGESDQEGSPLPAARPRQRQLFKSAR